MSLLRRLRGTSLLIRFGATSLVLTFVLGAVLASVLSTAIVIRAEQLKQFDSQAQAKKNIVRAVEAVAEKLGNTKAVCRKCYIHPAVIDAYLDRSLLDTLEQRADAAIAESDDLRPDELSVLKFLRKRLEKEKAA